MKTFLVTLILSIFLIGSASAEIHLPAIKAIESSGNPNAFNKRSGCIGLYQINPKGALVDFNTMANLGHYSPKDLYDPQVNEKIALWYLSVQIPKYLKHYGHEINTKNILWAYNAGIGKVNKGIYPEESRNYYKKYKKLTERTRNAQ